MYSMVFRESKLMPPLKTYLGDGSAVLCKALHIRYCAFTTIFCRKATFHTVGVYRRLSEIQEVLRTVRQAFAELNDFT